MIFLQLKIVYHHLLFAIFIDLMILHFVVLHSLDKHIFTVSHIILKNRVLTIQILFVLFSHIFILTWFIQIFIHLYQIGELLIDFLVVLVLKLLETNEWNILLLLIVNILSNDSFVETNRLVQHLVIPLDRRQKEYFRVISVSITSSTRFSYWFIFFLIFLL